MNSDQLYIMLATLNWKRAVAFGAILAALYFLLVYDNGEVIDRNMQQVQTQISQAEHQIKVTKEAFADAERFEREVKATVDQFSMVIDYMPENMGPSELMTIVSDLTAKTGLKLVKTEPVAGGERTNFYEPIRMSFAFEGSFAQILTFLSELSSVPRLITFEGVELSTLANTDPEMPQLSFTGTIVAYRYIARSSVEGGNSKQPGGRP